MNSLAHESAVKSHSGANLLLGQRQQVHVVGSVGHAQRSRPHEHLRQRRILRQAGGAVRLGKYKLLEYYENGSVQLFNLENDIGEQNDLSKREAATAKRLKDRLHRWRQSVAAQMMKPNPNYDPKIRAEDYYKRPGRR